MEHMGYMESHKSHVPNHQPDSYETINPVLHPGLESWDPSPVP